MPRHSYLSLRMRLCVMSSSNSSQSINTAIQEIELAVSTRPSSEYQQSSKRLWRKILSDLSAEIHIWEFLKLWIALEKYIKMRK